MIEATVVVPCFNEASRLDRARFLELARDPSVRLLFVDDGSRDDTRGMLAGLKAAGGGRVDFLGFDVNRGKAEAVRQGLLAGITRGAEVVGFLDGDLATPPGEMLRLVRELDERGAQVVLGARVGLAGTNIDRKMARHYLGRLFATAASVILRERFYDTQCGAKLFRVTGALREALARPFVSRWAFDVELIGRLLVGTASAPALAATDFVEVPLHEWTDVPGSKLRPTAFVRVAADLVRIEGELAAARLRRGESRK
jgi:glycosyltransferase involved in cell wall biosynthesis